MLYANLQKLIYSDYALHFTLLHMIYLKLCAQFVAISAGTSLYLQQCLSSNDLYVLNSDNYKNCVRRNSVLTEEYVNF